MIYRFDWGFYPIIYSINGIFNDLAKNEVRVNKFRTVVSDVAFFVVNPLFAVSMLHAGLVSFKFDIKKDFFTMIYT